MRSPSRKINRSPRSRGVPERGRAEGAHTAAARLTPPVLTGRAEPTSPARCPRDHFEMGRGAVRSKSVGCCSAFKSATDLEPTTWPTGLSTVCCSSRVIGEAEAQLRQAKSAGAVSASKYLGHLARDQGDISGASNHYQDYLRSGPADAKAIEIIMKQMAE